MNSLILSKPGTWVPQTNRLLGHLSFRDLVIDYNSLVFKVYHFYYHLYHSQPQTLCPPDEPISPVSSIETFTLDPTLSLVSSLKCQITKPPPHEVCLLYHQRLRDVCLNRTTTVVQDSYVPCPLPPVPFTTRPFGPETRRSTHQIYKQIPVPPRRRPSRRPLPSEPDETQPPGISSTALWILLLSRPRYVLHHHRAWSHWLSVGK